MTYFPRGEETGESRRIGEDCADDVREALEWAAGGLFPAGNLLDAASRRARGIRRRQRAVVVAAVVVVATGSGAGIARVWSGADRVSPVLHGPAGRAPATGAVGPSPPSAPGSASQGPTSPSISASPRSSGTATGQASSVWGSRPAIDDTFSGSSLNRGPWDTVYAQGTLPTPLSAWSPAQVQVSGGALRISAQHVRATEPTTDVGGLGSRGSARRYGRWEFRWRMTAGLGVIGQFLLVPAPGTPGPGEPRYGATLSSVDGTLRLSDLLTGDGTSVRLDGTSWHTVAAEWTPGRLVWTVDGHPALTATSDLPQGPVWPAFQTLLSGPDCGVAALPAECGGTRTMFPQVLEIDRFQFWEYQGP